MGSRGWGAVPLYPRHPTTAALLHRCIKGGTREASPNSVLRYECVSPAVGVGDEREVDFVPGVRLDVREPPLLGRHERVEGACRQPSVAAAVGTLRRIIADFTHAASIYELRLLLHMVVCLGSTQRGPSGSTQ